MWTDALLAYLHFGSIFTMIWFLAKEWTLLTAGPERLETRHLSRADLGYFIAAIAVVASGAARLAFGAKPWAFYAGNPVFHAKIGVFILVGIVSIWPTLAFQRWKRAAAANAGYRIAVPEWRRVRRLVMLELHLIALIPLLAVLMARGIGYRG
jgi:putative membrane protein